MEVSTNRVESRTDRVSTMSNRRPAFMRCGDTPSNVSTEWVLRAHYIVREAAEPVGPGESVKAQIRRAADLLGLTFWRATTFWYARQCAVLAAEIVHLERAHAELQRKKYQRMKAELQIMEARIASLEGTHEQSVARAVFAAVGGAGALANGCGEAGRGEGEEAHRPGGGHSPAPDAKLVNNTD